MIQNLFWNVDTQYDFMEKDGALYVPLSEFIRPQLKFLTELAQQEQIKVVNTADWHHKDSREFSKNPDFVNTFPPHCLAATQGSEFIAETNPKDQYIINWEQTQLGRGHIYNIQQSRNIVIHKDAFDVFSGNKHTNDIVDILAPKRVFVYGVATDVCVNFAVQGLLKKGIEVFAVTDAMNGLTEDGVLTTQSDWVKKGVQRVFTTTIENYL